MSGHCTSGQSNFSLWPCYAHSWRTTTNRNTNQKTELTAHHGSTALPQPLPLTPHSANVPENDNQPRALPPLATPLAHQIWCPETLPLCRFSNREYAINIRRNS